MTRKKTVNDSEIKKAALSEGFYQAEIIDTNKIVFNPMFRRYCEDNVCGQYGANYSCPPDCGTFEEMKNKVLAHKKALVLKTQWEIEAFSQFEKLKKAKLSHNTAMFRLVKTLKESGHNGFMIGASGCTLCKDCKIKSNEPCAYPDMAYSCMSAYCINVKDVVEECHMSYDYKDKILPFFGMYIFD